MDFLRSFKTLKAFFLHRRGVVTLLTVAWLFFVFYVARLFHYGGDRKSILQSQKQHLSEFRLQVFKPETAKLPTSTYTRTIVMGKLKSDNTSWLDEAFPDLTKAIYTVDAEGKDLEELRIPVNKGHEAMVYLTYIIQHYDRLPDVVLFFHSHKVTWHNNILLELDTETTIRRLNDAHVLRVGYMPSRCLHDPGCPDWLHVDRPEREWDLVVKPEEQILTSKLWESLHPGVPAHALSNPCCGQFAVSGERIRARPRQEYERYRQWLVDVDLDDKLSGRLMEYTWQYLFSGQFEVCPEQHTCYCDGYGICFGGEQELLSWLDMLQQLQGLLQKIEATEERNWAWGESLASLKKRYARIEAELRMIWEDAYRNGEDPKFRAVECGREWREGDGF